MISIHAARVGCDSRPQKVEMRAINFNPRSPSGLRPQGGDFVGGVEDFNPRSPSGLRRLNALYAALAVVFQSTQPEWAATV